MVTSGGEGVAVKSISPVSGKQVEYSPEVTRGSSSYTPAKGQASRKGTGQGTGDPGNVGNSPAEIADAVAHLNAAVDIFNKGLHFRIHEGTERILVEVINKDSGEVIREIPPEYILDILAKIDELLGIFIDERA